MASSTGEATPHVFGHSDHITVTMLAVKGTLQVADAATANSAALAGIAGLGHVVLAAGFMLLFIALGARLKHTAPAPAEQQTARR